MATLQTGDFTLRALPQVARLSPANFDAGIGNILGLAERGMQLPARLEQVRAAQRQGRLERATEPQRLELAQRQASSALELLPYRTAAEKEKAMRTESAGSFLSYDEQGNLVRSRLTVRTDPVTGKVETFAEPEGVKTAEDVAAERENAKGLAAYRAATSEAALRNAGARQMDSETRARLADIKSKLGGGDANMTVRVFEPKNFGQSIGYTVVRFNKVSGKFTIQRFGLNLQPVGEPVESDAMPGGLGDEVDVGGAGVPAATPATQGATARPLNFSAGLDEILAGGAPPASVPAEIPLNVGGALTAQSAVVVPPAPVAAPAAPAAPVSAGPVQIRTEAEYQALLPGTRYIDPNGVPRTKR